VSKQEHFREKQSILEFKGNMLYFLLKNVEKTQKSLDILPFLIYICILVRCCKKFNQSICVESGFGFYAVASEIFEKAMKNPLFRAYHEETAGIAQGRFLKVQNASGENQKFILVLTL
jgi:hypothetical protein